MKNYTIPFFIPHKGCRHNCVFCDQNKITGQEDSSIPGPDEISSKIELYLSTMKNPSAHVQVGFFGGSFTGIPPEEQKKCLMSVKRFVEEGRVHGIRLSTRPDLIDREQVKLLKEHGVTCVELGVQSISQKVLDASRRGHTPEDTVRASRMIKQAGFDLAHQIMLGLPESSYETELKTARSCKELGACQVRIYPVIVIKETELAMMWQRKEFIALSIEEAVERASKLILFFRKHRIRVIRCGLHPTKGLSSGQEYIAGPFHPSFGQLAAAFADGSGKNSRSNDTDNI